MKTKTCCCHVLVINYILCNKFVLVYKIIYFYCILVHLHFHYHTLFSIWNIAPKSRTEHVSYKNSSSDTQTQTHTHKILVLETGSSITMGGWYTKFYCNSRIIMFNCTVQFIIHSLLQYFVCHIFDDDDNNNKKSADTGSTLLII